MSHHFDTATAREDPRINLNDFYLFDGSPGTTVMAMTVNPDAGLSAPQTLHDEALYAFRFDLDGDGLADVTFKFRFGEIRQEAGRTIQDFVALRATGEDARRGAGGTPLLDGDSGIVIAGPGVRCYVGLAPELFAGDAAGLKHFMTALYGAQKFAPEAFSNGHDFFANRNVTAIVLEVSNEVIAPAGTTVHAWATVSLVGHAPEVQVSRWGLPLVTHIYLSEPAASPGKPDLKEEFNRSIPTDDLAKFSLPIAAFVQKLVTAAGSAANPAEYGKRVAARLCPTTLPYAIGTSAALDYAGFNGRALADDVMDVMLTLASNRPVGDAAIPNRARIRLDFPYFGEPFTKSEQIGVTPAVDRSKA